MPAKVWKKVVKRPDAGRLSGMETADNSIDRRRTNGDDALVNAQFEFGHKKQAAEHIGGIMRFTASWLGGVSRTYQGSSGGQINRRDPEDEIAVESLQKQQRRWGIVLLSQMFVYEGQIVFMRARNKCH